MKGIVLEEVTKAELLNAIESTVGDHILVLMTPGEAAALLGVTQQTVSRYKRDGLLKDYSRHNEYLKFSAREVLQLKRNKQERDF